MDSVLADFQDTIRSAAARQEPVRLRGGGTKDFYGGPLQGTVLDTTVWAGAVDHDAGELVLTARCGTSLAEIETLLADKGQRLPFDPPHFGADATLGGAVASGLGGPLRLSNGPARDHVLGVTMMDGRGDVLRFGGRVIKNVAGYDASRLMVGSMGTLGLLLDISLKLVPMPPADVTLRFERTQVAAIEEVNRWLGRPWPLGASTWLDGLLYVRLAGARAAVEGARAAMGGELVEMPADVKWWRDIREQRSNFFVEPPEGSTLWRLAVPSTTPPLVLSGRQLLEWGGGQRWLHGDRRGDVIRSTAASVGGHATAFRRGDRNAGVFAETPTAVFRIQSRLKLAFDPHGIFNVTRLHPDF